MTVLIDMNLSPEWVGVLAEHGTGAVHWSKIGAMDAPDEEIFRRSKSEGWVIVTQDLDFSRILFESGASGPSVVLLRLGDELSVENRSRVAKLFLQFRSELMSGALLVVDERKVRLRMLPVT